MKPTRYFLFAFALALAIAAAPAKRVSGDDEKLCPVHHVPLKREQLGIVYGLVSHPCDIFSRAKAEEKYFPYANSIVYGGCVVFPDSPKTEEVLYCPKCREVEKTWPCLETGDTPIITTLPLRKVPPRP